MSIPMFKQITWKSKNYLQWVREQPCLICGCEAEPHHLKGVGSMSGAGMKAPDWATMPLCHKHHMEMHGSPEMWEDQWEFIVKTLGRAVSEGILK